MRTRQTVLFLIGLAAQFAAAQTYTVPDEGGAAHQCMYRLRLEGGGSIEGVAFSNDGESLYLRTDGQAINVWEILVYYWPEVLGGLSLIVALPCLLLMWRVRRRPRIVGELHCQHCNYCVRGVESGICPECGRPIRRPLLGRPSWRRVAIPAALLSVVVVGYGGMWAFSLPRTGSANNWLNWWSYELEDAVKGRGYSLKTWVRPVVRIIEVDVQSGRARRTLITCSAGRHSWIGLVSLPSGRLLTTFGNELAIIDVRTASVRLTLAGPKPKTPRGSSCWHQVAGFEADGSAAYVVQEDDDAELTRLFKWDLRTGAARELIAVNLDSICVSASPVPRPHRLFHVPQSDPPQFVDVSRESDLVRVHEVGAEDRILGEFPANTRRMALAFADARNGVYFEGNGQLAYYHLPEGAPGGQMRLEGHFLRSFTCDSARRRVACCAWWDPPHGNWLQALLGPASGFLVGNLQTGKWIGRFTMPEGTDTDGFYLSPEVYLSPDCRYFAAMTTFENAGADGAELLVYDLTSLPDGEDFERELGAKAEAVGAP